MLIKNKGEKMETVSVIKTLRVLCQVINMQDQLQP